jgi:O-antigen/teichoic acid export membrane protein
MTNLIAHISLNTFASTLTKGFSFVVMLLIARSLTVNEYSVFGQLYSLQQAMVGLIGAGFIESVIRITHTSKLDKIAVYKNALLASIPITVIFLLVAFLILIWFNHTRLSNSESIAFAVALISGCMGGYYIFLSKLNRLLENHIYALLLLNIPLMITFMVGGIFVFALRRADMFFVGGLIGLFVIGILLNKTYFLFIKNSYETSKPIMAQIHQNIAPYILVAFLGWLTGFGNVFLIGLFLPDLSIAKYTFLYTFSGAMLLVANSINQIWSPHFYNISKHKPTEFVEEQSYFFYSIESIILSAAASFMVLFYQPLIDLIGGSLVAYRYSTAALSLIMSSFLVYIPVWHCRNHLYLKSPGLVMLKLSLIAYFLSISQIVLAIYIFGDIGIYIGSFCLALTQTFCFGLYAYKKWQINFPIRAISYGCMVVAISHIMVTKEVNLFQSLAVIVLLFSIYLYTFRSDIYKNLRNVIK